MKLEGTFFLGIRIEPFRNHLYEDVRVICFSYTVCVCEHRLYCECHVLYIADGRYWFLVLHCYGFCQRFMYWLNIVCNFGDHLLCLRSQFVNTLLPWLLNRFFFQLMLVRLQTVLRNIWVYLWGFSSQIHWLREMLVTIHFVEEVREIDISDSKQRTYSSEIQRKLIPITWNGRNALINVCLCYYEKCIFYVGLWQFKAHFVTRSKLPVFIWIDSAICI